MFSNTAFVAPLNRNYKDFPVSSMVDSFEFVGEEVGDCGTITGLLVSSVALAFMQAARGILDR